MNYQKWLKKAEEDEFAGRVILHTKQFPAPACFYFQQMAEKYLKTLVVFHQKHFPKVHDLLELETILLEIEPDITRLHEDLEILNTYYISSRYPGDYPEITFDECDKAYQAAQRIKDFVLEKIKL